VIPAPSAFIATLRNPLVALHGPPQPAIRLHSHRDRQVR
jgi:hypothetical protein